MNGLNRIPTLIRMCLASVITNLGMTLIQTRLKIPPPAPLSLSPLLPPHRCPVRCPPRSCPPFAHPPVCAPPSFPRRQGVQQGEPAPPLSTAPPLPLLRPVPPPRFLPRPFCTNGDASLVVRTPFRSCTVPSPHGFSPLH